MYRALLILVAVILSGFLPQPQDPSQVETGRIDSVRGPAVIIHDRRVAAVKTGDVLHANDIVQTGSGGRLQITLKDGSTLAVGSRTELRVVTHDPASQTTLIEMLHGRVRAHVTSVTKPSGGFEIRTPTARIRAIGTVVTAESPVVDAANAQVGTVISEDMIKNLPLNGRNPMDLIQLVPGTLPGNADLRSMRDYSLVGSTGVTTEEHFSSVTNFNPQIQGQTDLLPGEFTIVPKDQPPQPATPMYLNGNDYSPEFKDYRLKFNFNYERGANRAPGTTPQTPAPNRDSGCSRGSVINGTFVPMSVRGQSGATPVIPQFHYEVNGTTGISTGNALQIHFYNDSPCPLKFVVTNGAILRPTGFTGRIVEGLLLGTAPLKDYQKMYTIGGKVYLKPSLELLRTPAPHEDGPQSSEEESIAVPAGTEGTMMLRSFCVELHKLAPHPKSVYKFADAADQKHFAQNRALVDRAFHMVLTYQILLPPGQTMDGLVQWLLWKIIEGMDEKKFHDEFMGLVKKNYETQKKKWDKNAEHEAERMEKDLWNNIEKVQAGKD